jgi:hypothetical protein
VKSAGRRKVSNMKTKINRKINEIRKIRKLSSVQLKGNDIRSIEVLELNGTDVRFHIIVVD